MTDSFDEIDPESLGPEERAALELLQGMPPEERARFLGHVTLVKAAWAFLRPVAEQRDLRTAWPALDSELRLALAQQWVLDNADAITRDGFDRDEVAVALGAAKPDHELWHHFERVYLRGFLRVLPSPAAWGIGANTRLVAPDLEVLYLHDTSDLPDGVWQPDERRVVYPILMRWDGATWHVRNLGSETEPIPGWPPVLG